MIYFRYRKYDSTINCSFFAKDGPNIDMLDHCMIGDQVSLMLDVSEKMASCINDLSDQDVRAYSMSIVGPKEWAVHIPFRIVERKHSFSYQSVGNLQSLGKQIFLEAENGYWEDIFLWICVGEKPVWAREEQEE
jgi:hypothetical protein